MFYVYASDPDPALVRALLAGLAIIFALVDQPMDTIGARINAGIESAMEIEFWETAAEEETEPELREDQQRLAAMHTGAALGHLFRAAELAYDRGAWQRGGWR